MAPDEREEVTAEEYEALIQDEMSSDADAGGDAKTRRKYAEAWAAREYRVRQ